MSQHCEKKSQSVNLCDKKPQTSVKKVTKM